MFERRSGSPQAASHSGKPSGEDGEVFQTDLATGALIGGPRERLMSVAEKPRRRGC